MNTLLAAIRRMVRRPDPSRFARPSSRALLAVLSLWLLSLAGGAEAQTGVAPVKFADPDAQPRLRLGPFGVNPFASLTQVGVDSNVFSSASDPQRDFTAKFTPGLDVALRMGRARLSSRTSLGFSYFRKATRFRTLDDVSQAAQVELPLNRLTPRVIGAYARTRDRPSLEIDSRTRQVSRSVAAEIDARVGPRLVMTVGAGRERLRFEDETFRDVSLRSELDRQSDRARLDSRFAWTPLTTVVATVDLARDRFAFSSLRDADIRGAVAGFELKPAALISGKAVVGYRHVDLRTPSLPDFSGVVADIQVAYTLLGRTRFDLIGHRSVEYSYQPTEPYFVLAGGGLTVTEGLGGGWDVRALGSRDNLGYRGLGGSSGTASRIDRSETLGFGVGRRLGTDTHIGLDVLHVARRSQMRSADYEGWRFGGSFTYGQ